MVDLSPANARQFCQVARSTAEDVELALDAADAAKTAWRETSLTERTRVLNRIADAIEANLEMLAVAETWDNGKPVRETLAADIPLSADHFRYFAAEVRALEGSTTEIDKDTVAYHFHEPLGVVGQIIPFNFPLLMAAWKLAPALARGSCTVIKPGAAFVGPLDAFVLGDLSLGLRSRAGHGTRVRRVAAGFQGPTSHGLEELGRSEPSRNGSR
jgi:aldehyde dehydrogenase